MTIVLCIAVAMGTLVDLLCACSAATASGKLAAMRAGLQGSARERIVRHDVRLLMGALEGDDGRKMTMQGHLGIAHEEMLAGQNNRFASTRRIGICAD
jgi:hypothetical protein